MIIVDIDPSLEPSEGMLHGEPYIQEYRQNIEKDLSEAETYLIVKGQVKLWQIDLEKESN